MTRKSKLVLKTSSLSGRTAFLIVKTVNTLEHGVPGDTLTRDAVDKILLVYDARIKQGSLTVEFIGK